jgi:pimeloyl-ACP methyl ester carboxylesterase
VKTLTLDVHGPIHYADFGGSGAPIVLVHGLGGSFVNWQAVGPGLAKSGRVLALDLPGFGRTPPAGRRVTIGAQVETVGRFIEEVAGGPAVVVGNSMGGLIAAALAADHPRLVTRAVLVNPALPRAPGVLGDPRVMLLLAAYTTPVVGQLLVRSRRGWPARRYIDDLMTLCGVETSRLPAEIVEAMVELVEFRRTTPWAEPAFVEAARSVASWTQLHPTRLRETLKRVACPVLLLHGTRDRLVPVGLARAIASDCPDWQLQILEGIGHVPQLQAPERFVEIVGRWLGARSDAPAAHPAAR